MYPLECIEEYVKHRITELKVCACPRCGTERLYMRGIQYIMSEYKDLKEKDIKRRSQQINAEIFFFYDDLLLSIFIVIV